MHKYDNDFHFLDNIQYMALIEEPDATIKYANEHFCNFFHTTQSEVIGCNLFDFLVQEDRAACDMQYMVSPENPHYRVESRAISEDGTVFWLQFVGSGLFNKEGELIEFQEVCIDISMWKEQIEREVRKLSKANLQITSVSEYGNKFGNTDVALKPTLNGQNLGNTAMYTFDDIITKSPKMETLIRQAKQIAKTSSSVLIEGESGTGKELLAQSIHNASKRAKAPFVAINCGSISPELLQSELFGYIGGAFTGAAKEGKIGKFELADNGTLFLDEIGEMPLNQQISLLRVLETKTITRMGDHKVIPVNTRIICATNKNLFKEVCAGRFRNDLYFRLNVINLDVPPLRERKEDIYPLIQSILKNFDPEVIENIVITPEQMQSLYQSSWPGNVRQLRNIVERLVYMPGYDVSQILKDEVYMRNDEGKEAENIILDNHYYQVSEKIVIEDTLKKCRGNVTLAAKELSVSRNTLYKKIKKYNVEIQRE